MKNYLLYLILVCLAVACKTSPPPDKQFHLPATCGNQCADPDLIDKAFNYADTIEQDSVLRFGIRFFINRADDFIIDLINANLIALNEAFSPYMAFEMDSDIYYIDENRKITDFRTDFLRGGNAFFDFAKRYEDEGYINVFILETETKEMSTLLGFTPVLTKDFDGYELSTPRYDKIFLSYEGLEKGSTLQHEIGHFFSLSHPWELSEEQQHRAGLQDEKALCINLMNYNCYVRDFTTPQRTQMMLFAAKYRDYLIR